MLTVGLATDAGESVALDDALETLTLGGADDIDELDVISDDVGDRQGVAQFQFTREIGLEFEPCRAALVCFSFFSS